MPIGTVSTAIDPLAESLGGTAHDLAITRAGGADTLIGADVIVGGVGHDELRAGAAPTR